MSVTLPSPLGGKSPVEIPLAKAPLERVIAQVQFSHIIDIDNAGSIGPFQNIIRGEYPHLNIAAEQIIQIQQGPMGQSMTPKQRPVYTFHDVHRNWRITLTSESLALDVKKYTSRHDFLKRWSEVLKALGAQFSPFVVGLGMRYIDRIKDSEFARVNDLIKEVYLGPLFPKFVDQVQHMISETVLRAEEGNLLLRLGKLPSGGTFDPNVLEPVNGESFIVDIDVSQGIQMKFEQPEIDAKFRKFAERAYTMFRDIVTEEFDRVYGGST